MAAMVALFLTPSVHAGFFGHDVRAEWRFADFDTTIGHQQRLPTPFLFRPLFFSLFFSFEDRMGD